MSDEKDDVLITAYRVAYDAAMTGANSWRDTHDDMNGKDPLIKGLTANISNAYRLLAIGISDRLAELGASAIAPLVPVDPEAN